MPDKKRPSRFDSFRHFLDQAVRRRSHFSWGPGDVEHHPPPPEKKDRSGHLGWGDGDVEHKKIDEDASAYSLPHILGLKDTGHRMHWRDLTPVSDEELQHQIAHRDKYDMSMHDAHHEYKIYSTGVNDFLRKGRRESSMLYEKSIPALDRITSLPTLGSITGYRGFGTGFPIHHMVVGHEFTDHGYTGISRKVTVAAPASYVHADHQTHWELNAPKDVGAVPPGHPLANHHTIAHIYVPPGTKGHLLDMPDHRPAANGQEHEFLLHRGTRFRVMGHSKATLDTHTFPFFDKNHTNLHIVHLNVVGQR